MYFLTSNAVNSQATIRCGGKVISADVGSHDMLSYWAYVKIPGPLKTAAKYTI